MPERKEREFICILCPLGCILRVRKRGKEIKVEGNRCPKGVDYGRKEFLNPERVLVCTVRIKGGFLPRLPVRSRGPLPKDKIIPAVKLLHSLKVEAPIKIGEPILKNILNTGVDIVSTRNMERVKS